MSTTLPLETGCLSAIRMGNVTREGKRASGSRRIFNVLAGSVSILAILTTGHASAQPSDQPTASNAAGLEEVVVTARRKEEKAQSVPIALETFNQTQMESQEVRALNDLQKNTPAMQFCCSRSTVYNIWMRAVPGVVAYFDEVPLINFNGYSLFLDSGSLQILKGPQGTLFGQAADGGAILYQSKPAVNNFEGSVEADVGDYNHREGQFVVNVPIIDDKFIVRAAGQYDHTDGYVKDLTTGAETGMENYWIGRITATVRPTDDIQNDLLVNYYSSTGTIVISYIQEVNPAGVFQALYGPSIQNVVAQQQKLGRYAVIGGAPLPGGEYDGTQNTMIINNTRWDINENMTLKNILGYQEILPRFSQNDYFGVPYNQYPMSPANLALLSSKPRIPPNVLVLYSEELQVQGKMFDDKLSYTLGTFNDWTGSRQPAAPQYALTLGANITGNEAWGDGRTNAVYGQATYDLAAFADGLSFTGGYRYTWDKQYLTTLAYTPAGVLGSHISQLGNFHAPSYTLSLDYQLSAQTLLYVTNALGYSKGGFNGGATAKVSGISSFLPESLNNIEVGIKSDWELGGVKARTNLSFFYAFYDGIQNPLGRTVPSPIPGAPPSVVVITSNAANGHIEGVDGDITIVPTESLQFHTSFEYLEAVYDKWDSINSAGMPVDLSNTNFILDPRWKYAVDGTYRIPIDESLGTLSFTASYSWTGHQPRWLGEPEVPGDTVPAYDNLDMSVAWHNVLGRQGLDARAYVTNVLENVWADGGCLCIDKTYVGVSTREQAVPRQWGAALRYSFGS